MIDLAAPVVEVARELVGWRIAHGATAGTIVETEAYHQTEPACHAFAGLTARTRTLFGPPGRAYVYRSYGIHAMLNAVCEPEGTGAAVLIRALEPLDGIALMTRRRAPAGGHVDVADLCRGPGNLTRALGITLSENRLDLASSQLCIEDRGFRPGAVAWGPRVGIRVGVEHPWRCWIAGNSCVSGPRSRA